MWPDRWRRTSPVPAEAADRIAVGPGERLLAAAQDAAGLWAVASTHRLYRVGLAEVDEVAWHDVSSAAWSQDQQRIVGVEPGVRWLFTLADPGRLPEVIRERVTRSVLASRTIATPSGSVQVAARRPVNGGDPLYQVVADPGVDVTSALVSGQVSEALAELRALLG